MKYYKKNNQVFAFELDGSQDNLITEDMVKLPDAELDAILNPPKVKLELVVSPWQLRKALNQLGLRDAVEGLVSSSTTPRDIRDGWEFAAEWREFDPTVKIMGAALNLNANDIHAIFEVASGL